MRSLPALMCLVACSGNDAPTDTTVDCTEVLPGVTLLEPAGTVAGPDVTVRVEVTDFAWVEATASSDPGLSSPLAWLVPTASAHDPTECPSGHAVVTLDGVEDGITATDTYTLVDVPAGDHTVAVELVYPDGDTFFPQARDEVSFTVE